MTNQNLADVQRGIARDSVFSRSPNNIALKLPEDLAELPRAGFAGQPLRATHRTQRKSAPRVRIVPQLQLIAVAHSAHQVLALRVAHSMRLNELRCPA